MEQRYMKIAQAAEYLGTTAKALYKACSRKTVPHKRRGKLLVFDRVELDRYMAGLDQVRAEEALANGIDKRA